MKITAKVALENASHEGLVREAYKDATGTWTWSVGVTDASGHSVKRYIDNPQSIEHCLKIYVWLLENKYAPSVRKAFKGFNLSESQFAAALSYHWNTGAIRKAKWVKLVLAGRIGEAERSLRRSRTTSKGRKLSALVDRRKMEADLFFNGTWSNKGKVTIYPVTKSHTPYGSRGKRVDITKELEAVLKPVEAPKADYVPTTPKPKKNPSQNTAGWITAALVAIGAGVASFWDSLPDWLTNLFNGG